MASEDTAPETPTAESIDLRVGVVDVEQTAGNLIVNDLSQYFDQRKKRIKQCPPHLYVLFKREDGRRPTWGGNKAYIEEPKLFLPGLENLAAGRRIATEVVPRSHQAFHFKVAADTSDDAYFEHDVRVVFSVKNPIKFIDMTGLDAKVPESAAHVGERFFTDFMAPIIRARLDSLTKKVDSDGINTLNAHPEVVGRYMFNQNYDVDGALFEINQSAKEGRASHIPPQPDPAYDVQWDDFFADYGVRLERFVSSIDQSKEIAAANLQKAQARAAAERAKIDADIQLYVQQKQGEAAAAGAVAFLQDLHATLSSMFGDRVRTPEGFRQALGALAEYKALNNPEPGQKVFINIGGSGSNTGGASGVGSAELLSRIEAMLESHETTAPPQRLTEQPKPEAITSQAPLEPPAMSPLAAPETPALTNDSAQSTGTDDTRSEAPAPAAPPVQLPNFTRKDD